MTTDIIKKKQKTLIFVDYDVDGISSITILQTVQTFRTSIQVCDPRQIHGGMVKYQGGRTKFR